MSNLNHAELIKKYRIAKNLTQDELGRKLGYTDGKFISQVERSKRVMPVKSFTKLTRILGISRDTLFSGLFKSMRQRLD